MPIPPRKFEAPPLTHQEEVLGYTLRARGKQLRTLMDQILPDKGSFKDNRTKPVEYQPSVETPDSRCRLWLERNRWQERGFIRLMQVDVSVADIEGGVEWPIKTVATVDPRGRIIDEKYYDLFPVQKLLLLTDVLERVRVIEAGLPTDTLTRQLGRTAIGE